MIHPIEGTDIYRLSLPTPFEVGNVNVFLIKSDPLILIDTGPRTGAAYDSLAAGLKTIGVSIRDIELILITHGHLDHIGLLGRLMEESGAESWAHPHAAERTASYDEASAETGAFYLSIMREFGVPDDASAAASSDHASFTPYGAQATVSHVLEDGAKVARYTAYHVPGHSSSDTVLFDTERREGFVGDHVLATTNPNPLIRRPPPGQPRPKSLLEFMASLRRTHSLDIDWCCPGHGEPFRNHREVIDRLLKKLDERSDRVLNCLQDTPLTPYQLSRCLYPNLETKYVYLGISVAIGHLEVLEADGRVTAESDNGVARYRKTEGA